MIKKMLRSITNWFVASREDELHRFLAGSGASNPAELESKIRDWERKQSRQYLWF